MFTKPFALVFAAAAALSVSALDIYTPEKLTQCGSVEIQWSGKKAPFILTVLPSCDADSEDPLLEFAPMNATSYKWTVNLPSSTGAIAFAITDNEGNEAYTDEVTIEKSDDASCLSGATSSAVSASSIASTASISSAAGTSTELPRTTLVISSAETATAAAPVNVGSGVSGSGSSSGSSSSSGSGSSTDANTNGAIAPVAPAFAVMIGAAASLLALL